MSQPGSDGSATKTAMKVGLYKNEALKEISGFYIFADQPSFSNWHKNVGWKGLMPFAVWKRVNPRLHAFSAGMSKAPDVPVLPYVGGVASLMIAPTVRARYTLAEIEALKRCGQVVEDPLYSDMAYIFKERVPPYRFGMTGTLFTAVQNPNWFARIPRRPGKVLTGCGQLAIAYFYFRYLASVPSWNRVIS